jgi:hypothetical protein
MIRMNTEPALIIEEVEEIKQMNEETGAIPDLDDILNSKRSNSSIVISQNNKSIPQNDFSSMLYSSVPVYTTTGEILNVGSYRSGEEQVEPKEEEDEDI